MSLRYSTNASRFSRAPSARLLSSGNFLRSIFLDCTEPHQLRTLRESKEKGTHSSAHTRHCALQPLQEPFGAEDGGIVRRLLVRVQVDERVDRLEEDFGRRCQRRRSLPTREEGEEKRSDHLRGISGCSHERGNAERTSFSAPSIPLRRPIQPRAPAILTRIASPAGVAAVANGCEKTSTRNGVAEGPTVCVQTHISSCTTRRPRPRKDLPNDLPLRGRRAPSPMPHRHRP